MATNLVQMLLLIFLPPLFKDPIVCYLVRTSLIKEWSVIVADKERRARVRNMGHLIMLDMLASSCDFSYSGKRVRGWDITGQHSGTFSEKPILSQLSLFCVVAQGGV